MSPLRNRRHVRKACPGRAQHTKLGLETLEERTLLSVLLGDGGQRAVRFHDASGDLVSLRLRGPGSAVVTLQGDAATGADLQSLVLQGSDARSRLTVQVRGEVLRPLLTGSIDVGPGGLGALVVRGALASSVFSRGPIGSIEAGAVRGAVVASTTEIGQVRVAGRVVSSTILAGLDMVGDVPGDGNGVPGTGRIGRVRIAGSLSDTTLAAGVAPGPDGRFGTPDDIAALGPRPSTIGPVTVGGRIFAGHGAEAAVVVAAADRTPALRGRRLHAARGAGVLVIGPIAPRRIAPSAVIDPIDRSQLVNVSNQTHVHYSGIFNDIRTRRSTVNVQVTNTSSTAIPTPLILVVESISDPSVTVANADGIVTPDGASFFNLTGQVPGTKLNPGATTSNRPLIFNNPLLHTFTITTSVNYELTNPPPPTVTLSLPSDSQGRDLIGIADGPNLSGSPTGMILTVTASGTAPVAVNLGQSAAGGGSRGAVFFGDTGTATTATVTTSGGANNVAQVRVRGDSAHPSAYQGDLNLTASVGATTVATQLVTVFRIAPDSIDKTLVNDAVVPVTLTTTPAVSGLDIAFQPFRGTIVGNQIAPPFVAAPSAINVFPSGGASTVQTGADGTASFSVQQGDEGEGLTAVVVSADYSNGQDTYATAEITTPVGAACTCCGCPSASTQFGGTFPVQLYAGEESLTTTDLTIPGRGFDFQFTRTYRSQDSELRPIDTNDLGVDWGFSYSDDRLLPDGNNVILFSPTMRTDTFLATSSPGAYTAPMGFFDQLTVDASGNFELRDSTGMVKTYASFSDPNIPGRLISESDPEGDLMTFHYAQIDPDNTVPGDQRSVLSYVIDTLGREIRFQYYARTSQTVDGRVVTITDPAGNAASFGRLAHVIDFKGDMTFDGSDASADFSGQTNNRTLTFTYDTEGNLVSETSPAVTGTPDGNDFPGGKTTRYDYTRQADIPASITGVDRGRLLHNLTAIEAPNEAASDPGNSTGLANPRVTFTYGTNPADPATFDRVLAVTEGGTNVNGVPAGGTIEYSYQIVSADARTTNDPYLQLTVTDRNGNVSQFVYSPYDTLLSQTAFTSGLRNGEPASYVTTYRYDKDKMLIRETMPDGNTTTYIHDHLNPDRLEQDNLLRTIQTPDAARGGDQTQITTAMVYEPIYQHPAVVTDPRGLDPSYVPPVTDPSGRTQLERYSTHYFFDYQESPEKAAQAPNDRIDKDGSGGRVNQSPLIAVDPNVLTVEVWLVQILRLPETAAGLATLRNRLASNGIPLGLGDLNGDGDTTPQVDGNVVRIVQPTVVLLPGSNQAGVEGSQLQPVVTLMRYNPFGQLTSVVDPEGNVTEYTYFSEQDPDGDGVPTPPPADGRTLDTTTGGYLEETAVDTTSAPGRDSGTNPTPVNIQTNYAYDDVGNMTSMTDGRGIRTDYFVNELNQIVQTTSAAAVPASGPGNPSEPLPLTAFAYIQRNFYDYNNNVVISQVEDRGNTSDVDGNPPSADLPTWVPGASNPDPVGGTAYVDTLYQYDILDEPIEMVQEVSNGANPEFLHSLYRYDPDGNNVLIIQPEGNATSSFYDERNLLFQAIAGATSPPPRALLAASDPTNYDVRGGLPATTTYNYDPNGNLIETVAAADEDLSAANNSTIAGVGDRTRYVYDGFDRQTAMIDSVGDETVMQYDPAGNVVRTTQFGPVGGPSPTADGPDVLTGPVSSLGVIQSQNLVDSNLLAATETSYDELDRPFQTAQVLFVNTIPTVRTPGVAEGGTDVGLGDLNPGQTQPIPGVSGVTILGRVTDRTEYDRDSRTTFSVGDARETSRAYYDGAGRVIETIDPAGNTVETAYDADSNVIERREIDVAQVSGVADEVFLTTNFYDSLDRLKETVDNLGETTYYRYDSRNNLVAMADAQGPVNGQMIARRAFPDGPRTVDATNGFGNITLYDYDGLDRQTRTEQILTASGGGDGTHIGASIYGVKDDPTAPESSPPAADPSQGGGDGIIRTGTVWDGDSLPTAMIDDNGNVTLELYDDLDRKFLQSEGLVVGSDYSEANILAARVIPTPTAATIDSPATISDARIADQLAGAGSRIAAVASLFPSLADQINDNPPTTKVWGYDPNGDALIIQDENGSETFTRYDAIDRPIAVRIFRAGQADSFAGDPIFAPAPVSIPGVPGNATVVRGTTIQNFQYDGLSRETYAFDNNDPMTAADDSTVTDAYDSLGRVIEETQQIGGQPTRIISSAWGADDLRAALTYPNGRVEVYTYDDLDRLKTVSDQGAALPIAAYNYIGEDRVLERLYPQNGTLKTLLDDSGTVDIGYDGDRRPIEERDLGPGNALIVGFTYTYDRMGNKLTEGKLHDPDNSEVYTYDSAYRLITFNRAPGGVSPSQTSWTLDGVGNWVQVDGQSQQYSSTNELIGSAAASGGPATVQYDNNGNQTDDGTYLYAYDAQNRLRTVSRVSDGQLIAVYSYDSMGRRIEKVVTNSGAEDGTTTFGYDGWRDIDERDGSGTLLQQYVFGAGADEPLVMDRNLGGADTATGPGDQRLFYNQNSLGSVYALTDASGRIVEGYQYDAYGRQTVFAPGANGIVDFGGDDVITPGGESNVGNPWLYTGQRFDAETGLGDYVHRYYSPSEGRFLSRDPAGYSGGVNLYAYAYDDPTRWIDPLGLRNTWVATGQVVWDKDQGEAKIGNYYTSHEIIETWFVDHKVKFDCINGDVENAIASVPRTTFLGSELTKSRGPEGYSHVKSETYTAKETYTSPTSLMTELSDAKCPNGSKGVNVHVYAKFEDLNNPDDWSVSVGPNVGQNGWLSFTVNYQPGHNTTTRGDYATYEATYQICCCCQKSAAYSVTTLDAPEYAKTGYFKKVVLHPELPTCPQSNTSGSSGSGSQ